MPAGKASKGAYTRDPCAELHCNETGKPLLLGGGPAEWALNKDNFGTRPDKAPRVGTRCCHVSLLSMAAGNAEMAQESSDQCSPAIKLITEQLGNGLYMLAHLRR